MRFCRCTIFGGHMRGQITRTAATLFILGGLTQPSAAQGAWPNTVKDETPVFAQLVSDETDAIDCGASAYAAGLAQADVSERERTINSTYSLCREKRHTYSCNAPIVAVRNAQLFFNQYYRRNELKTASAPGYQWAKRCDRLPEYLRTNFRADFVDECEHSESLLLPLVLVRNVGDGRFGWGGQTITEKTKSLRCRNMKIILQHEGIRCRVVYADRMTHAPTGKEFDDAHWDVCRVLRWGELKDVPLKPGTREYELFSKPPSSPGGQ